MSIKGIFKVTAHKNNFFFFWYLTLKAGNLQFLPCQSTLVSERMPVGMLLKNNLSSTGTI